MDDLDDWRRALRLFIGEHVGYPLIVGDLFELFGEPMPLHSATRMWCLRNKLVNGTPEKMRWYAFSQQIRTLNVDFNPPIHTTAKMTKTTTVTAHAIECALPACRKPFFGQRDQRYCSRECGNKWQLVQPRKRELGSRLLGLTWPKLRAAMTRENVALADEIEAVAKEIKRARLAQFDARPRVGAGVMAIEEERI